MRSFVTGSVLLLLCLVVVRRSFSGENQAPPAAEQLAGSYPAHDEHKQEKTTVAADPYDSPQKNTAFHYDYFGHGLLPVRFVISNDSDLPLSLTSMQLELDLGHHSRVEPASEDEILRRMFSPKQPGPSKIPLPIPLPHKKDSREQKISAELEQVQFKDLAVEPHTTHSGIFFFDISGISAPLSTARLVVSKIRNGNGEELFYFEVPLADAVGKAPSGASP